MNSRPELSVVMPAYNEEHRLEQTLTATIAWLRERDLTTEIIIVADGSHDRTVKIANSFAAESAPESQDPNRGTIEMASAANTTLSDLRCFM